MGGWIGFSSVVDVVCFTLQKCGVPILSFTRFFFLSLSDVAEKDDWSLKRRRRHVCTTTRALAVETADGGLNWILF